MFVERSCDRSRLWVSLSHVEPPEKVGLPVPSTLGRPSECETLVQDGQASDL